MVGPPAIALQGFRVVRPCGSTPGRRNLILGTNRPRRQGTDGRRL